jgi:hypothetical protein
MMDEITMLREAFGPDAAPSVTAETRARTALVERMRPRRPGRHRKTAVALAAAAAIAVTATVTVRSLGHEHPSAQRVTANVLPFAHPANVAQYFENAAWTAERRRWVDPRPEQFMYTETVELRNQRSYENNNPNGALVPGKTENRRVQQWNRVDGQVQAEIRGGKLEVVQRGGNVTWDRLKWADISALTTPEKVANWVDHPDAAFSVELTAMIGQYVLPPKVQAAIFRYLAQQPDMRLNPDAVNIDGRPAIGLGRVLEGYLAQELLFDQRTYALIGERVVAIADHVTHGDDADLVSHKGDVYRQVLYTKMIIVDRPGDTQ